MSVAFRSSANVTNGTAGTTVVVSLPAGALTGDFLVAFIAQAGTAAVTAPAGWTLLGSQATSTTVTLAVYYKRAFSEPGSWTWTLGASLRNWGWVGAYTGVDTSVPINSSVPTAVPAGGTAFSLNDSPIIYRFGMALSAAAAVRTASGVATTWTPSGTERADLSTNVGIGNGTDIAGEVQDTSNSGPDTFYGPVLTASQSQTAGSAWGLTLNPYWRPPTPSDLVSVSVEAAFGADLTADPATWTWTDVTSMAKGPVQITRGRADESQQTQPSKATLRLDNANGWLTPRHPNSPWYLRWGLGTPMRVKVNQAIASFVRCQGRVTQISPIWPAGTDSVAFVDVEFQGALQQLNQGESLHSALYRAISADNPLLYWPCEDGSNAQQLAEASGGPPLRFVGGPPSLHSTGPLGADGVVSLSSTSTLHGLVNMPASATAWTVVFYSKIPSAPGISTPIWEWHTSGTIRRWRITIFPAGGIDTIGIEGFNSTDTRVIDFETNFTLDGTTEAYGVDLMIAVSARQNGANIEHEFEFSGQTQGAGKTGGLIAGTFGAMSRIDTPFAGNSGWLYGHLAISTTFGSLTPSLRYADFFDGGAGQAADVVITNAMALAGVSVNLRSGEPFGSVVGSAEVIGPLPIASPLTIARQAEDADLGILTDGFGAGLDYLSKRSRFNRAAALVLDARRAQVKLPFEPVESDQRLRNKVTASRTTGSSATAVAAATSAIGVYPDQPSLNLADDSDLANQAGFRLALGTVKEMRAPVVTIDLRDRPELIRPWLERCDIGARYTGTGLVSQYTPDGLDQIIEQYVETLHATMWRVQITGSPFAPWRVFTVQDSAQGRADFSGATLQSGVSAVAAGTVETWSVATTVTLLTTTAADFPYDVDCEGERVTVTNTTGGASPQTVTVTRGVNGISKAHTAGATVSLWHPPLVAF